MNILMFPLILASLVNQIQISPNLTITAHILNEKTVVDMNYLALTPSDFITIKSIVESTDNECKNIINEAIGVCHYQIEACHSTCNSIPDHQKNLIKMLKSQKAILNADIKLLEKQNEFFKYAALIGGSLAIGASTYIILK
tara:strand:- start:40 stop:462 length:423 start_codon:yes stop_codon:yes gene_type:complete